MDRAGRRPLLLYPMAAMIVVLAVITAAIKFQVRTVNVPLCGPVIAALGSRYRYSEYLTGGLSLPPVDNILSSEKSNQTDTNFKPRAGSGAVSK